MPINLGFETEGNSIAKNEIIAPAYCAALEETNFSEQQLKECKNSGKRRFAKCGLLLSEQCYFHHNAIHTLVEFILTLILIWAAVYVIIKEEFLPHSDLFKIFLLIICSYCTGFIFSMAGLPHVVGLYATGSVLKSVGYFNLSAQYKAISAVFRYVAISVTITKGGLGFDVGTVLKHKWTIFRYSFIYNNIEALVLAVLAKYVLNFPWLWSFMFGYVICATSSAASLNELRKLKSENKYKNEQMQETIENSAYIDNIYSISAFTVFLTSIGFVKNGESEIHMALLSGLLDLVIAIMIGLLFGFLTACFPHKNDNYFLAKRCLLLSINGTCTYFGCKIIGVAAGGALACFVAAATSSFCWKAQGWTKSYNPVLNFENKLWNFLMEPILFGLVGTEVDLRQLDISEIGTGIWMLIVTILVKCIVGMMILIPDNFNVKEKIFIIFSWMPKATVQSALSPQMLDTLNRTGSSDQEELDRATLIIALSVLSVVFITTLFSIILKCSSNRLLVKKQTTTDSDVPEQISS
ncbi:hypothetical protein O3M35_005350 [Rhynocoris fuscipes]|uniref:Cation/H+ exchanger transmembrane domain-containing protein n=1 Tax=Rhynocoris fuscipes TaxID=488301 RepID=A0AAW1DKM4_9HEMI